MYDTPTTTPAGEILLTTGQVARRWQVSVGHLQNLRSHGRGPTFIRLGRGGIRYRLDDIRDYEQVVTTTDAAQSWSHQ